MQKGIAIQCGHNATISFYNGVDYFNIELERLKKERYFSLDFQNDIRPIIKECLDIAKKHWNISNDFDFCCYSGITRDNQKKDIESSINSIKYLHFEHRHHFCHATSTLYQSPYLKSLIISFDGGGDDGYFNVYIGEKGKDLYKIKRENIDLGACYGFLGTTISEIKGDKTNKGYKFLSFAGKIMGLAAYGTVNQKWINPLIKYYKRNCDEKSLILLGKDIKENLSINSLSGQKSFDLAATSQFVFECLAENLISKYIKENPLPLCLTGGCALNVLLNEKLKKKYKDIYIPPNPDDGGLTFGMLVNYTRPLEKVSLTYSGLPILDIDQLEQKAKEYNAKKYTLNEVALLLKKGFIIGVLKGNSEHGPRALGNRSILCNPSFSEMKDILNEKVKQREWFRPFAPVVRLEDCNKYFDLEIESEFMSFASKIKKEWKESLSSVCHKDDTARVQTITEKQNSFLYNLLTEFNNLSNHGVLLNTSFNIKGKPILTTIDDALEVLDTTKMDFVIIEDFLFKKK